MDLTCSWQDCMRSCGSGRLTFSTVLHRKSTTSPDFSYDTWPIESTFEDDCFLIKFRRKSVKPLIVLILGLILISVETSDKRWWKICTAWKHIFVCVRLPCGNYILFVTNEMLRGRLKGEMLSTSSQSTEQYFWWNLKYVISHSVFLFHVCPFFNSPVYWKSR